MISGWQVAKANITLMDAGEGSMVNRRHPAAKMQNIIIVVLYLYVSENGRGGHKCMH